MEIIEQDLEFTNTVKILNGKETDMKDILEVITCMDEEHTFMLMGASTMENGLKITEQDLEFSNMLTILQEKETDTKDIGKTTKGMGKENSVMLMETSMMENG